MANIILGIHGLGNKPPCKILEKWWRKAMKEGLRSINANSVIPEFELVYWSDILHDKPLDLNEKNPDSPYYLDEKYTKASDDFAAEDHATRRRILDYLGRQVNRIFLNEDFSLNYSFLSDILLKRYFSDLEAYYSTRRDLDGTQLRRASELIRERLCDRLYKHKGDEIMLISHSMGSIIAFDVLTFMAPDIKINTFVTMGSPLGLPLVISRIAAEQMQHGNKEKFMVTPPGVVKNWYNFSDILDKVAFNYKLADDFSENNNGIVPVDYQVVNNYEINGIRNPHKSFGYLRAPEFSKILNEFILSEKVTLGRKVTRKVTRVFDNLRSAVTPSR